MSVGFFLGIRNSYPDHAQGNAANLVDAINRGLAERSLEAFEDTDLPADAFYNGQKLGRSSLDHHGAKMIARLGEMAEEQLDAKWATLLERNPYRLVFLPQALDEPIYTDHTETIWGSEVAIIAGSLDGLLQDLIALAPELGIPTDDATLSNETARRIDQMEPLVEDEDEWDLVEDGRTAWLALYEAARVARDRGVALCLAG